MSRQCAVVNGRSVIPGRDRDFTHQDSRKPSKAVPEFEKVTLRLPDPVPLRVPLIKKFGFLSLGLVVAGPERHVFRSSLKQPMPFAETGIILTTARELMEKEEAAAVEFEKAERILLQEEMEEVNPECSGLRNMITDKMRHNERYLQTIREHRLAGESRGLFGGESIIGASAVLNYEPCTPASVISFLHHCQTDLPEYCFAYCHHSKYQHPEYSGDTRHVVQVVITKEKKRIVAETLGIGALSQVPVDMLLAFICD